MAASFMPKQSVMFVSASGVGSTNQLALCSGLTARLCNQRLHITPFSAESHTNVCVYLQRAIIPASPRHKSNTSLPLSFRLFSFDFS